MIFNFFLLFLLNGRPPPPNPPLYPFLVDIYSHVNIKYILLLIFQLSNLTDAPKRMISFNQANKYLYKRNISGIGAKKSKFFMKSYLTRLFREKVGVFLKPALAILVFIIYICNCIMYMYNAYILIFIHIKTDLSLSVL